MKNIMQYIFVKFLLANFLICFLLCIIKNLYSFSSFKYNLWVLELLTLFLQTSHIYLHTYNDNNQYIIK